MRLWVPVCLALALGLGSSLTARQGTQQPPVFRSSARLVPVSVAVRDGRNRPVEGLVEDDFQILEDGREQPIALFIAAPPVEAVPQPVAVAAGSESRFTNRIQAPSGGGVVAIIFDQLNTSPSEQARARDHLLTFLRTLRPGDRVGLYVLGADRLHVLYDFTQDAEMLTRALTAIQTGSATKAGARTQAIPPALLDGLSAFATGNLRNMNASVNRLRAEITVEHLENVAKHLAGVPGRKNVIWLSSGFPFLIGPGDNMSSETKRATRALNTSDVTLYPVDTRGLLAGHGANVPTLNMIYGPIEGLRLAADWTGGRTFFNSNGLSDAMTRAVEDSRSTYVLGYYPDNPTWDGTYRAIKVHVKRKRVEVRHRPGYLADPVVVPGQDDRQRTIADALAAPLEATALPFEVSAEVGAESTLLRIHLDASTLTLAESGGQLTGEIDVAITQMLVDRRHIPEVSSTYPFSVPGAARQRLLASPIQLTRTVRVSPDATQVRIVVRDTRSAAVGSVFIDAERLRPPQR